MGKKIKTILFDFDGTIADTMKKAIEIYNQLALKNNFTYKMASYYFELTIGTLFLLTGFIVIYGNIKNELRDNYNTES